MQLLSNDRFKSVEPRISAVSFFLPCSKGRLKPCGPIKELLSDNRITSYEEFMNHYRVVGQIGGRAQQLTLNCSW
ncbi:hypothetical protein L3X38_044975 [Prunus dulcis]|uniref:Uncharacterized protein n=1 Tax=Prunus dulcis TaxID=3755 RepID=A0AAD4V0Z9_PRUDU|nr:hypothetical protein L3X38_044975 [Prunus dulcis]